MGFQRNRFIDSNDLIAELICSICLNVFDNAITSNCYHIFCKQCIQQLIETNEEKKCPRCGLGLERTDQYYSGHHLVSVGNYVFISNQIINNIVSKLKIKCNFDSNGCQESVALALLPTHLKECRFRPCNGCEMPFGSVYGHNCIQLLKNDRNEWKRKFNEMKEMNQRFEQTLSLTKSLNSIFMRNSVVCNFSADVIFGNYLDRFWDININDNILITRYCHSIGINYESINELMYCLDSFDSTLIIRPDSQCCHQIRSQLESKALWFDVESDEPSKRYIIIKMIPQSVELSVLLINHFISRFGVNIECVAIDAVRAKQMVDSALRPRIGSNSIKSENGFEVVLN